MRRLDPNASEDAGEADQILDAFEDALTASSAQLKHLLRPTADSDEQKAFSAELLAWLYNGGWVRWGWPEAVGGFGGSATVRAQLYERLALRLRDSRSSVCPGGVRACGD